MNPLALTLRPRILSAGFERRITELAWSADGRWLAGSAVGGPILLFDAHGDEALRFRFDLPGRAQLTWSSHGALLAVGGPGAEIITLCLDTGRADRLLLPGPVVRWLGWLSTPATLAVATDRHVLVVQMHRQTIRNQGDLTAGAEAFAVCQRTALLAAGGPDTLDLHDLTPGGETVSMPHLGALAAVAFSPQGGLLAGGHHHGVAGLWALCTSETTILPGSSKGVESIVWRHDGNRLATTAGDEMFVWALENRRIDTDLPLLAIRSSRPVGGLAYQPGGTLLAAAEADGAVGIWAPDDGRLVAKAVISGTPSACAWHPAANRIAVGTAEGLVTTLELH